MVSHGESPTSNILRMETRLETTRNFCESTIRKCPPDPAASQSSDIKLEVTGHKKET